ncbi:protein NLP2 [Rhodamnia argentea]|uniref:Protein NLP2 n=1 Tax=Rhodamnia argentea TaxID=178133 RepID=A0A8B8NJZ9_9MYRT|nr:protein NLP2 [Rhodamnia argentea]
MEDVAFTPNSTSENLLDSAMDLDLMDQLLFEGCWLETTDASNYLPSTESDQANYYPFRSVFQEEAGKDFAESLPSTCPRIEEILEVEQKNSNTSEATASSSQSEGFQIEGTEVGRRWWIAPVASPGPSSSMKERLMMALGRLKEGTKDKDVLIQIWVPVKKGGRNVLTTIDQPYVYDPNSKSLESYRNVSKTYQFVADEDTKESVGLPGRVFLGKLPEWTPDVRFFSSEEYPRLNYAQQYDVRGSLALPVFERGSGTCLGVVEIITTSQKINYRPELENICKALEAVDLRSSQTFRPPSAKACNPSYQAALPQILEVLTSVCKRYRLPLALTWASCLQQGKEGPRHSNENYEFCVSTVDSACFVADQHYLGFQEACSEHHLLRGQGIVGRAFTINRPCFATDVTAFNKREYPLAHHARMLGLCCATAIPLASIHTGSVDFVLEFFFPKDCKATEEQKQMINSLSSFVHQALQNSQKEQKEVLVTSSRDTGVNTSDKRFQVEETDMVLPSLNEHHPQEASWIANMVEAQKNSKAVSVPLEAQKEHKEEFTVTTKWEETELGLQHGQFHPEFHQVQQNFENKPSAKAGDTLGQFRSTGGRKSGQRTRTKTDKTISLEVLRQYFAGSLKDAAKSIGVCPTTLKRICRQHGITRWPSRKIKKVGHSLKKLESIINSVQGAEGTIHVRSFYESFPELNSPRHSEKGTFSSANLSNPMEQLNPQTENGLFRSGATTSNSPSSSCSQSSGSITSCSTGMKQYFTAINAASSSGPVLSNNPSEVLKRTRSDAELHISTHEEPKLLIRSQSHKSLVEWGSLENVATLPKTNSPCITRDVGVYRIKAILGEEKIRFSLKPSWGFRDLQWEVAKRFNIDDIGTIDLKYLDDDQEWVLLTCDADLEECIDVNRMSRNHTIRISIHQSSHHNLRSLVGGSGEAQHQGHIQ